MAFLHFVSLNSKWVAEIQAQFGTIPVKVSCEDIRDIPSQNTVFVSPANCLGYMDGGIDLVYSEDMFPGIERTVQEKIRSLNIVTFLERAYLPIGSAVLVPWFDSALLTAPTMFLPQDVHTTKYAYHSFLAALLLFDKYRAKHPAVHTLVATSHCCGFGNMSEAESAKQMKQAYDDFLEGTYPDDASADETVVLMPSVSGIEHGDPSQSKDISLQL